ncbi:MAG TPA: hypothetical protein VFK92_02435 [Burkholderiales bacterium]|nr:hypothetical protein [Burkholderiales bacterium]
MKRALAAVATAWQFLRDVVTVLRPCRFSALVVAAGAALLLSAQGLEFTVRLPSEGLGKSAWFDASVFLWAFQSWYWARLLLDLTFGDRNAPLAHPRAGRLKALIVHTPRVLAAGSYLVAVAAGAFAGTWGIAAALAVEGVLFYAFLVLRRPLVQTFAENAAGWKRALLVRREGPGGSFRSLPLLSVAILVLTLACGAVLTVWVCRDAVDFGWTFGSPAVPFLGFSMLVPVGSLLVFFSRGGGKSRIGESTGSADTRGGYPVITLLLLLALALSFFPAFDNHALRTLPQDTPAGPALPLDEAFSRWQAQAPRASDGRTNLVVVATAGGGLRAAYWTATVLGAIQDRAAGFKQQLFAVSGVSGGSLGAAVFVTLASGQVSLSDRPACESGGRSIGRLECDGQAVLSQDFLAPPVAALLFPDLMQRFFPFGFPDRAKALEQSWEAAWRSAGFDDEAWANRGFRSLWPADRFVPALLLNSTHVETGKRVIASNLDVAGAPKVFRDAWDLYELLPPHAEIRASTAAHTSARFTYLSPAGTLADGTHLVDGGYFENFGAVTAGEVLRAAVDRMGKKVRPIAILISNDTELNETDLPRNDPQRPRGAPPETFAAEALSPPRALLHTRDARGLLAASELRQLVEDNGGDYFQFRLCKEAGRSPALGWVLSGESEQLMRSTLVSDACGNGRQLRGLVDALRNG